MVTESSENFLEGRALSRFWGGEVTSGTINFPTYTGRVSPSVPLVYFHLNFKIMLNWTNNHKCISFLSLEFFYLADEHWTQVIS